MTREWAQCLGDFERAVDQLAEEFGSGFARDWRAATWPELCLGEFELFLARTRWFCWQWSHCRHRCKPLRKPVLEFIFSLRAFAEQWPNRCD